MSDVLSAALDSGVAVGTVIIYFSYVYQPKRTQTFTDLPRLQPSISKEWEHRLTYYTTMVGEHRIYQHGRFPRLTLATGPDWFVLWVSVVAFKFLPFLALTPLSVDRRYGRQDILCTTLCIL